MTQPVSKRLYRSRTQRVIAGVCGGIAEYFNIDPTFIRLLFVALFFLAFGASLIVYAVFWVVVPKAPLSPQSKSSPNNE